MNTMNDESNVSFIDTLVTGGAAFLSYRVRKGHLTNEDQERPSEHDINFIGLHMSDNIGLSNIIMIEQDSEGTVTFTESTFHGNKLSDPFSSNVTDELVLNTAIVSVIITGGNVTIENCIFENNSAALGGPYI